MSSCVTRRALAFISIFQVDAGTAVQTWPTNAIIYIIVTRFARKSKRTWTFEAADCIRAFAAISAWARFAFVNLNVTHSAAISGKTGANISVGCIGAGAMYARFLGARHCLFLTVLIHPARTTYATIAIVKWIINASSSVQAWFHRAVLHARFTFVAHESWRAFACERSMAGIEAGSTILARTMSCAVVQILVTEKTTPAFFATAFPWFLTVAMITAWVGFAFVTVCSFPPWLASMWDKQFNEVWLINYMSMLCV